MRYVAAYMLALLGGNAKPTEKDIKTILSSVGIDAEADNLKKVLAELSGKNIDEVIAAGEPQDSSVCRPIACCALYCALQNLVYFFGGTNFQNCMAHLIKGNLRRNLQY
jgi:hypothetical protein